MRASVLWLAVGFAVGVFWLVMAFIFFSAGQSLFVDVLFDGVAVATCPPLLFGHDYFLAPFLNAILYWGIASIVLWARSKHRVKERTQ